VSVLKIFKSHKTPDEKKKIKKERLLLILSGVLLGISFPPFPFPFVLLSFVGFIPYLIVLRNRQTLAEMNRATYLMAFVFCVVTVYWVGSWQAEADPFLMMGGGAMLLALPAVMIIPSTLYYLSIKVFKVKISFIFTKKLQLLFFFLLRTNLIIKTKATPIEIAITKLL